jgi:hypothetical protein
MSHFSEKSKVGRQLLKANPAMEETTIQNGAAQPGLPLPLETGADQPRAWEMIENGRYQPRRIKGSCVGRELGWTFVVPSGPEGIDNDKQWFMPAVGLKTS